jgi:cyclopropane-fatty-acyl-phospholipid synthase
MAQEVDLFQKTLSPSRLCHVMNPLHASPELNHELLRSPALPAAARLALKLLQQMPQGSLHLVLPAPQTGENPAVLRLGVQTAAEPTAIMKLYSWQVFERVLSSGDVGLAEGYIEGEWDSPDVVALLGLFLDNRQHLEQLVYGRWWMRLYLRLRHAWHRNSKKGSQKNIHAHYDIGNAFYDLWLDKTMNYSSAWFEGNLDQDLSQAQQAKVRRALRMAQVKAGDRVLELGCGWGGLAEVAVGEFGAQVTGVTLSSEQLQFAQDRMHRQGFAAQAELRHQDYRDIADGPFDAICSIEMFEAVGREFWSTYFRTLMQQLKPGGLACIQTIVIDDAHFKRYLRSSDFIQQYIFPGGTLPSPSAFVTEAQKAGLQLVDRFAFGGDYAETLKRWRVQFKAQESALRSQGFDQRFMRIWAFYLMYCEAGFRSGSTDVVQFTLRKPV